jgi:hypothetical protein
MAFGWFKSKDESVEDLVGRKDWPRAVEMLRDHLKKNPKDLRLRQQLADTLVSAGKPADAIEIFLGVADDFAADGFVAKAIAVLKKVQKLDSHRQDVEEKLASLVDGKEREAETGQYRRTGGESVQPGAEGSTQDFGIELSDDDRPPDAPAPSVLAMRAASAAAAGTDSHASTPSPADELAEEPGDSTTVRRSKADERRWREIATTPLFTDFTKEELIAVIRGMRLRSFEQGDIIVTEKEPGESLFVISTGRVKVFTMSPKGQHVHLADLSDGDFFGEVSVLTGKPRTATITAATRCEVLELDRPAFQGIASAHPHVREVLEDFYKQRATKTVEAMIASLRG